MLFKVRHKILDPLQSICSRKKMLIHAIFFFFFFFFFLDAVALFMQCNVLVRKRIRGSIIITADRRVGRIMQTL